MSKRPLEHVSYAAIANARSGARSKTVDIPCPVCGPQREGAAARRKVMRTWQLAAERISLHFARCELEGYVVAGGTIVTRSRPGPTATNENDDERARRIARLATATWEEADDIQGSPGAAYLAKRGIDLVLVPDCGGLRWHPRCPWKGGPIGCVVSRYTDAITGEPRESIAAR